MEASLRIWSGITAGGGGVCGGLGGVGGGLARPEHQPPHPAPTLIRFPWRHTGALAGESFSILSGPLSQTAPGGGKAWTLGAPCVCSLQLRQPRAPLALLLTLAPSKAPSGLLSSADPSFPPYTSRDPTGLIPHQASLSSSPVLRRPPHDCTVLSEVSSAMRAELRTAWSLGCFRQGVVIVSQGELSE